MKNLVVYLCDLLFPPKCIYCGDILKPEQRPLICDKCKAKIPDDDAVCSKCGGAILHVDRKPACPTCKAAGRYFDCAYSTAIYENETRDAIIRYKYKYQPELAEPLSWFLVKGLRRVGISNRIIDFAVSVPADSEREKIRGFDSAGMIAKYVAKKLDIEYKKGVVKKYGRNEKQSTLNKREREENVKGVFAAAADVKGKSILLVDDIITTGATAAEVSKILKRAGAKYVFVATVARGNKTVPIGETDEI